MTDAVGTSSTAGRRGLASRTLGVLTSPRATYAAVAADPRSAGILAVVLVATIVPLAWLLSTDVGRQAAVDQQLQTLEAFGRTVSDQEFEGMQRLAPYAAYFGGVGQFVGLLVSVGVVSGVMYAIFTGALGANATFRQVAAVVSTSTVILALRTLFATPLNYARESLSNPTTLSVLFPLFDENTFGASLLGSVDLFVIWWIVSLSIGLGVLYKRRTGPIAATMLAVYGIIAVTIAAVRSAVAGA
jgi:Yip1-like protein